jgi:hypothetical protein
VEVCLSFPASVCGGEVVSDVEVSIEAYSKYRNHHERKRFRKRT